MAVVRHVAIAFATSVVLACGGESGTGTGTTGNAGAGGTGGTVGAGGTGTPSWCGSPPPKPTSVATGSPSLTAFVITKWYLGDRPWKAESQTPWFAHATKPAANVGCTPPAPNSPYFGIGPCGQRNALGAYIGANVMTLSGDQDVSLATGALLPGFVVEGLTSAAAPTAVGGALVEFLPGSQVAPRPDSSQVLPDGTPKVSWSGFQVGRLVVAELPPGGIVPLMTPLGQTMRFPGMDLRVILEVGDSPDAVAYGVISGTINGSAFAKAEADAICSSVGPLGGTLPELLDSGPPNLGCDGISFGFGFEAKIKALASANFEHEIVIAGRTVR